MKYNNSFIIGIFLIMLLVGIPAVSAQLPAAATEGPVALTGGHIVTVSGEEIEDGTVVFENGKILEVGKDVRIPEGAKVIELEGKYVYPAMIHARSTLGLSEIGRFAQTVDLNEIGSVNPNVRAQVAYNAGSEHIPLVRTHGIAVTVATPRGGIISGMSAAMLTDGWEWEEMTLEAPIALIINWPDMKNVEQRDEQLRELQQAFDSARRYMHAKLAAGQNDVPYHNVDVRWESMVPVLEGEVPVHIFANDLAQIQAAISWAEKERLKMVLVGAKDARYTLTQIKEKNIPVVVTPVISGPARSWEGYDSSYSLPALLHEEGIDFCIAGENSAANVIRLPYHAASAVAFGLPVKQAIESVTLGPARILGIDHLMGSVEPGKDASLVITDGNILELSTVVSQVYIRGKAVDMMDKHLRLYELYNAKYEQKKGDVINE